MKCFCLHSLLVELTKVNKMQGTREPIAHSTQACHTIHEYAAGYARAAHVKA